MLTCREVAGLANDYIDNDLPWHRSMAMSLHLSICKRCSGFVQKLRLVITLIKIQPPETLSVELAEDIVKTALERENESPRT